MAPQPIRNPHYVVLDMFDEPVFNETTQTIFFSSIKACKKAFEEYSEEFVAEDLDTGELLTRGEEDGTRYTIFKEVKVRL